jgi:hypothetical protein
MDGLAVAVLGVLNQENHQKRDDRGARIDDELPGVAEVEEGAADRPTNNDETGEKENPRLPRLPGGKTGETREKIFLLHERTSE